MKKESAFYICNRKRFYSRERGLDTECSFDLQELVLIITVVIESVLSSNPKIFLLLSAQLPYLILPIPSSSQLIHQRQPRLNLSPPLPPRFQVAIIAIILNPLNKYLGSKPSASLIAGLETVVFYFAGTVFVADYDFVARFLGCVVLFEFQVKVSG